MLVYSVVASRAQQTTVAPTPQTTIESSSCLWQICSIDTMKDSRDLALQELNNPSYDAEITKQMQLIKATGANYVAIDTPYDDQFLPYLTRWVTAARAAGLHVWFRGNWSNWEGWFGYPKTMTPQEHLKKTSDFIISHPDLFADGDIFDACPECENAGYWPQPAGNQAYNQFLQEQHQTDEQAFAKIGKNVYANIESIIGGRAKEVVDKSTTDALSHTIAIDHYISDPNNMVVYVDYFYNNLQAKVLVSEFGAPIPDINGPMTEDQQATFVNQVFSQLFRHNRMVVGVNYFVLTDGSTALLNNDDSPRKVYEVIKKYFTPAVVSGTVHDTLGNPVSTITVRSRYGVINVKTDNNGNYSFKIPPQSVTLIAGGGDYTTDTKTVNIATIGAQVKQDFVIAPTNPNLLYKLQNFVNKLASPSGQ